MALPNTDPSGIAAQTAAKTPAKKLIPILLGGAGLVLLGGGGILVGLNSKLTTLQTSAQQKDAEVSSSEQIAHRYQATQDSYNQTQTHLQFLETSVSDKAYVPTLLAQLPNFSRTNAPDRISGASDPRPPAAAPVAASTDGGTTVGVKKAPAPPSYDTLDVAVDVSGTYADTSMFVYSLTRFPKIVSLNSVQMHPGTAAVPGGPVPVMTSLKLTAYMFHDAPAAGSPQASQTGTPITPAVSAATVTSSISAAPAQSLPAAASAASMPVPAGPVPPAASGTVGGAVGRAAAGAAAAASQADTRSSTELKTL